MSAFSQQKGTSKLGVDLEKEAGKRRDVAASLRQKKKDDLLREKRRRDVPGEDKQVVEADSSKLQLERIPELSRILREGTPQQQLEATVILRKVLSCETQPPIDEVIQANCIPKLVEFLSRDDVQTLQFEASWALTNIASGRTEHTHAVIAGGAIPEFVRLLSSPSEDVREQSVWALGNIAGDSASFRDRVLQAGVLDPILRIIHTNPRITTLRNATWCLSNFFRSKPPPKADLVRSALLTLATLLNHSDDEVVADACWALSNASDGENDRIAMVLELNIINRLVELLSVSQYSMICPALRTVGNIATGDTLQTQAVLDAGALPAIVELMKHTKRNIRKECCWTLSNLTAGTEEQIQLVIEAGALPLIVSAMASQEYEVKKEALWAISNLTAGGSHEQIYHVVTAGCLVPMIDLLSTSDPMLIVAILKAFENILMSGEAVVKMHGGENEYKNALESCGGAEKIENLQSHSSRDVYEMAAQLVDLFFEEEDDTMFTVGESANPVPICNF